MPLKTKKSVDKKEGGKKAAGKKAAPAGPTPTYALRFKDISAQKLVSKDLIGKSDPYIEFELEGSKQKTATKYISNSNNPVWAGVELGLDGYALGNDLLKVTVMDHDMLSKDDAVAMGDLLIRDIPLGVATEATIPLFKCSKGKRDKKATPGSGGTVKFKVIVQQLGAAPWVDAPWNQVFHTAHVEILSAKDVPIADRKRGSSDPFIVAKILSLNDQKTKTRTQKKNLNPVWNERKKFYVNDLNKDEIKLTLFDDDSKGHEDKIAEGSFALSEFTPGADPVERAIQLKGVEKFPAGVTAIVKVWIDVFGKDRDEGDSGSQSDSGPELASESVPELASESVHESTQDSPEPEPEQEPEPEPEAEAQPALESVPEPAPAEPAQATEVVIERVSVVEEKCIFHWGSYSSSYSTSFSGYTSCSQTLSPQHGSESDHWHQHTAVVIVKKAVKRVKGKEVLKGVVKGARNLIKADSDGTDSYVTVQLVGKGKAKKKTDDKSKRVEDTSDPDYDYAFDLGEVKKGLAVEFIVWQTHKFLGDAPIGYARKEVKDIELDDTAVVEIELKQPKALKRLPKGFAGTWGTLLVEFNKTIV
jgi:hypothetical protein